MTAKSGSTGERTSLNKPFWPTVVPSPGFAVLFADGAPYGSRTRLFRLKSREESKSFNDYSEKLHHLVATAHQIVALAFGMRPGRTKAHRHQKRAKRLAASNTTEMRDKRRIKTQTVLPSAETAAMLFWALLASGQITFRKVDGWQTLDGHLAQPIDLAA